MLASLPLYIYLFALRTLAHTRAHTHTHTHTRTHTHTHTHTHDGTDAAAVGWLGRLEWMQPVGATGRWNTLRPASPRASLTEQEPAHDNIMSHNIDVGSASPSRRGTAKPGGCSCQAPHHPWALCTRPAGKHPIVLTCVADRVTELDLQASLPRLCVA